MIIYDAGVLIAADRDDRRAWARHRARLEAGLLPVVPSAVVAQASRSPAQVQLRLLLRGCEVMPLTESGAHAAGQLMGVAGTADIAGAVVAHTAAALRADVLTADRADISRLLDAAGASVRVLDL